MKMTVTSKKVQVGQSFTDYAEAKLAKKLDRFFGASAEAKITVSTIRENIVVELTVRHGSLIFRAEQIAAEKNEAFDVCIDKIIRQIRKNKTKVEKRLSDTAFTAPYDPTEIEEIIEPDNNYSVDRTKRLMLSPMTIEEAILQMNLLGHPFFMFINDKSGEVNVVYKRDCGGYSLIEAGT
ncbi:MAG: ribosome-associated translation inhibitor RaiA [Oscillospiraceae bacterium]|nr:ribosome-associated translation inhibitor RaiA [Oscillospiraceae bacterium]